MGKAIAFGKLNDTPATQKRPAALYRGFATTVELYGQAYRAVVVHSSAHDKRWYKRIDRMLQQKRKELEAHCKNVNSGPFYYQADAEASADKIMKAIIGSYHRLQYEISKVPKYPRGRPAKESKIIYVDGKKSSKQYVVIPAKVGHEVKP